jgi:hypothetical protein
MSNSLSKLRKSLGLQRPNLHGARVFLHQKCQIIIKSPTPSNPSPQVRRHALESDVLSLQGQTLGKGGLAFLLWDVISCLQRKRSSSSLPQGVGYGIHSMGFMPQRRPKQGLFLHKCPPSKVLQRQVNAPSKGLKSNISCQVKSHLIQEPSKHVHQIYLFKLNKCSKTLCNFPNLDMGGVS